MKLAHRLGQDIHIDNGRDAVPNKHQDFRALCIDFPLIPQPPRPESWLRALMMLAAYLHGTPDRLPFVGHFRSARSNDVLSFAIAGRVGARGDISHAFRGARTLESALLGVKLADCADRHELLQNLWSAVCAVDGCDLGHKNGADLVALLAVRDGEGTGIAGAGLGGVWDWSDGELAPVVTGDHPLLNGPGRLERLPGVLTLDIQSNTLVAVAHDHPVPTLQRTDLARLCGVNP